MRQLISHRIKEASCHLAGTRIQFDEFIADVADAHIELLNASKGLDSLRDLLLRSGHKNPAQRIEKIRAQIEDTLSVLRVLDHMYQSGNLRYGPRAPQVDHRRTTHGLESFQEKPSTSRPSRALKLD